jgi:hypothetical protein
LSILPSDAADSNTISDNELDRAQYFASSRIDPGIRIDFSARQSSNTRASIRPIFDPDSKVNEESSRHNEKHSTHRISTDAGMQIERNDEHRERALNSIRVSFDPDSNVTDEIVDHLKHSEPRTAIFRFTVTLSLQPKYRIAASRFESIRQSPET